MKKLFPGQLKSLKLLTALILFLLSASAQYDSNKVLQPVQMYGPSYKNFEIRNSLIIPKDTPRLALKDSAGLGYKGGQFWGYDGVKWFPLAGSSTTINNCNSERITGSVLIDSGFNGHTTDLYYRIGCKYYNSLSTTFSITPSHVSQDRYTIVYVDTLGNIGTHDGDNASPDLADIPLDEVNVLSELILAIYLVRAGSTTPDGVVNEPIYREHVEWSSSTISGGVDFDYTTAPYAGLKSIRFEPSSIRRRFAFQDGTMHSHNDYTFLKFWFKLVDSVYKGPLVVFLSNGSNRITHPIWLYNGFYGLNANAVGTWQLIAIPFSHFQVVAPTNLFDKVEFVMEGLGGSTGPTQIDDIFLQGGGTNTNPVGGVTSWQGGDGSTPRTGAVIFRQTDDPWSFRNVILSADSLRYIFQNNLGDSMKSVSTLMKRIIAGTNITLVPSFTGDSITVNSTGGGLPQHLQSVTDVGNRTTRTIVSDSSFIVLGSAGSVVMVADTTTNNNVRLIIESGLGEIQFSSNGGSDFLALRVTNVTGSKTIEFPDADGTLVMSVNGVPADISGDVQLPYKSYAVHLTQSGTSDPVPDVLYDGIGGSMTWSRFGVGAYQLTSSNFTTNKTVAVGGLKLSGGSSNQVYHDIGNNGAIVGRYSLYVDASNQITLSVRDSSNAAADLSSLITTGALFLEVRVYN